MKREVPSPYRKCALENVWDEACQTAEAQGLFQRLSDIYDQVPAGRCKGCTACCSESVSTFFVEWLAIRALLQATGRWEEALDRAEDYARDELARPMKCPMLELDGRCMVYQARPLTCRVFGHLNRADYERNLKAVRRANQKAAAAILKHYGIELPTEVVNRQIPFCEAFESEMPMTSSQRDTLYDALFSLDSKFLMKGLLAPDQIQLGLVEWFSMVRLDPEVLSEERLARAAAASVKTAAGAFQE